jgi:CHAD domain-containing protein
VPERELKLEVPPRFQLPDFSGVAEGISATVPVLKRLRTIYWDTPDLRLARWGCSLRFRRGEGWTVKLPPTTEGVLMVRGEHAFKGEADAPPAQALDLLHAYIRRAELQPVATLTTRRTSVSLSNVQGRELAEVVHDDVSVLDGKRLQLRFRQLEVEARNGRIRGDVIDGVVARLRQAGAEATDPTPKHVRALGPPALQPAEVTVPEKRPAHGSAAAVVRRAVALSVVRLLRHDAGVRLGQDAEDVHQARVATRRLRSDLRTFATVLDPVWTDELRAELKWLAGLLGAVRDADVMAEGLRDALAVDGESLRRARPLLRVVATTRRQARQRLLLAMRAERYTDLLERLVRAAQTPALLPEAEHPAAAVLIPGAARRWARLRKAVKGLDAEPRDDQLHALRIAAKRCRYAAEAVAPVAGGKAAAFAVAVARLQTTLGDFHDAVVLRDWLQKTSASLPAEAAYVAGELGERQRQAADSIRRQWRVEWKRLSRKRLTRWMATS